MAPLETLAAKRTRRNLAVSYTGMELNEADEGG